MLQVQSCQPGQRARGVRLSSGLDLLDDHGGCGGECGLGKRGVYDLHFCAYADGVVKIDDILGAHADAAEAGGFANVPLLRCAVDVDAASKGVAVAGFQAAESEDAGDDGIATRGIGLQDLACKPAALHDAAGWRVIADFFPDLESAERGGVAAGAVADAILRGGDVIFRNLL